jgi:hypothetical protein
LIAILEEESDAAKNVHETGNIMFNTAWPPPIACGAFFELKTITSKSVDEPVESKHGN